MWLTGNQIKTEVAEDRITISPFYEKFLNPNSYNYRLSSTLLRIANDTIDLNIPDTTEEIIIPETGYKLLPGECYLGSTIEIFGSQYFASLVTGRSSIGRKFITNHVTAGLIDQGFLGTITLEITVIKPTVVYPGIPFGQIFWFDTLGVPLLYEGKYQNQLSPTTSRFHLDRENR